MLTLLAAFISALVLGFLGWWVLSFGPVVTGLLVVGGFLAAAIPLNLWVKKRMQKIFSEIQSMMERDQEKMRRQVNQMQGHMMGSPRGLQKQLEKQQTASVHRAVKVLDQMAPLKKWNLMARKQADTMRAQLYYQAQDFEAADRHLQNSLNVDPMTVAMKMARLYQKGEVEQLEKLYKKVKRRFKGDKGIVLHCLYAWVLVKRKRIDEALDFLASLKEKTDHQVVRDNWEHLANGRVRSFSNAGLGEMWYALHLEQPRATRVRQHGGKRR